MKSRRRRSESWTSAAVREARVLGYFRDGPVANVSGHVPAKLLKAAKQRAGVRSDDKLLVIALSVLAAHDDFGERFLKHRGRVDPSLDLDF